jgi:hypothetical protein
MAKEATYFSIVSLFKSHVHPLKCLSASEMAKVATPKTPRANFIAHIPSVHFKTKTSIQFIHYKSHNGLWSLKCRSISASAGVQVPEQHSSRTICQDDCGRYLNDSIAYSKENFLFYLINNEFI